MTAALCTDSFADHTAQTDVFEFQNSPIPTKTLHDPKLYEAAWPIPFPQSAPVRSLGPFEPDKTVYLSVIPPTALQLFELPQGSLDSLTHVQVGVILKCLNGVLDANRSQLN